MDLFSKPLHGELIAYFRPEYVQTGASDMFREWLKYISPENLAILRGDIDAILASALTDEDIFVYLFEELHVVFCPGNMREVLAEAKVLIDRDASRRFQ